MEQENMMIDPETGEELHRGIRKLTLSYRGESIDVDMPGWYSEDGTRGIHSREDMRVSDRGLNIIKARVEGLPAPTEIRSIRKKMEKIS